MTTIARSATMRSAAQVAEAIAANIRTVLHGKDDVVALVLVGLLAEGHILLEDVPGVGKTTLAKALAGSIDGVCRRVQFTPDLLPADVVGVNIWNRGTNQFEFRAGPVFTNILVADEINRASPKTQSALLEAMAERQVTLDGHSFPLGAPFLVLATQNPVDHEGTYPLPESQLDRFLLRLAMGYPDRDAQAAMLNAQGDQDPIEAVRPVVALAEVVAAQRAVRQVTFAPELVGFVIELAEATRSHPQVALPISPRATLALQRAARARATIAGRDYATPDDVKALAAPVLAHRLIVTPEAQLVGTSAAEVLADILRRVAVPIRRAR
jgi:MoxR-like ATPase